ncbi:MAG: hypothetical protein GF350_15475 [Chitinivibrionales bacterium]|nr:hypothetical protein [Chitinivibrionales bacterium]
MNHTLRLLRMIAIAVIAADSIYAIGVSRMLGRHELYGEIDDPYYASCGVYLSLTDSGIPLLAFRKEPEIYGYFFRNIYRPNAFLIECGIYPAQLIGAGIKHAWPQAYDDASVRDINVVEMLTRSMNFPEPWSVSLFCGHVGRFGDADTGFSGRGNIGLLFSYGNYHITNNSLYRDHWIECETKLKVDKGGSDRRYALSYRIGARLHANRNIKSIVYVGLRRDRTDFEEKRFSLIKNTNFEIRVDCAIDTLQFQKFSCEAGKKYPVHFTEHSIALGLSIGMSLFAANPYNGSLGDTFSDSGPAPIARLLVAF